MRLWNLETQVCVLIISGEEGHTNEVLSVVNALRLLFNSGMQHICIKKCDGVRLMREYCSRLWVSGFGRVSGVHWFWRGNASVWSQSHQELLAICSTYRSLAMQSESTLTSHHIMQA